MDPPAPEGMCPISECDASKKSSSHPTQCIELSTSQCHHILFMEIQQSQVLAALFLSVFGPIFKWFKTSVKVLIPGQHLIVCHCVDVVAMLGTPWFSSPVRSLIISFYSKHHLLSIPLLYWRCWSLYGLAIKFFKQKKNKLYRLRVSLCSLCWLPKTMLEELLSEGNCPVFLIH